LSMPCARLEEKLAELGQIAPCARQLAPRQPPPPQSNKGSHHILLVPSLRASVPGLKRYFLIM
jgi:hypothetical protein